MRKIVEESNAQFAYNCKPRRADSIFRIRVLFRGNLEAISKFYPHLEAKNRIWVSTESAK
jgi:hypothetical protein